MNQRLSIIYRACNRELRKEDFNQSRPEWFNKKKCWSSFYDNFGRREDVDIWVVFDGEPEDELAQYISSHTNNIRYLNNVGNKESLVYCYGLVEKLVFDYVFFAEDDYLYLPNSYYCLMEGLNLIRDNGFVTLYGHLNRYLDPKQTGDVTFGHDYILLSRNSFWRSEDSTTGSAAMSKGVFDLVKGDLISHNVHDCAFYREQYLKYNRRAFSPLPPKSTHVNRFFASPLVDWQGYNSNICL